MFVKTLVYHAAGPLMPYPFKSPARLVDKPHSRNGHAVHLCASAAFELPVGREASITSPGSPSFCPHPRRVSFAWKLTVFGFGSLCVMVEGRCALSSYATGQSPNNAGVCSPPSAVRWDQCGDRVDARLGGILIDRFEPDEPRGYPTLCKGRFDVDGTVDYAIEEPTSLNTLAILPELMQAGVSAIKIEGRQRSAAYVEQVTRTWRQAIDACKAQPERYSVQPAWTTALGRLAEGQQHTLGAFSRPWQ